MLLVAAAALVSQAVPVAPAMQDAPIPEKVRKPTPRGRAQAWLVDDDYPPEALRRHEFGTAKFRLQVDAVGKVTDCHITGSSGYFALDELTCTLLRKRAEFNPGRDAEGKDIPFAYNGSFTWVLPGSTIRQNPISAVTSTPVDSVVSLQALPKSYANPALLRLVFAGDTVKSCIVEASSGNAKLDAVACEQVKAQVQPVKVEKASWASPDSRMATVTFEATK
jgi:TonB family protein